MGSETFYGRTIKATYMGWIFPGYSEVNENLPEETTLHRKLKEYLLSGKKFGIAIGHLVMNRVYAALKKMSMESYKKTIYTSSVHDKLAKAEESITNGNVFDAKESVKSIREKYGLQITDSNEAKL